MPIPRILDREHALVTTGLVALITLNAFEALAVTTIMPTVSRELGGAGLFALAFAGPLATGVVGMVAGGAWSDRRGPAAVLVVATALFAAGLTVCALTPNMPVLVVGRLLQGLGGGAVTVAIYVVVGQLYTATLQPAIFAAFSAAWVLPSIVGPGLAALIAEQHGWRWVFGGVVLQIMIALAVVWPALGHTHRPEAIAGSRPPLLLAGAVAAAVLGVELCGRSAGWSLWATPVVAALAVAGVRGLLPAGTLVLRSGIPAVIGLRGLFSASFFSAEAFLPLVLQQNWGLTPARAGLALTGAALGWAGASQWQARRGRPLSDARVLALGAVAIATGASLVLLAVAARLPVAVILGGYVLAAVGMGLGYPRTNVAVLRLADERDRGRDMSALAVGESLSAALALSLTGVAVAAGGRAELADPSLLAFAVSAAAGLVCLSAAYRARTIAIA